MWFFFLYCQPKEHVRPTHVSNNVKQSSKFLETQQLFKTWNIHSSANLRSIEKRLATYQCLQSADYIYCIEIAEYLPLTFNLLTKVWNIALFVWPPLIDRLTEDVQRNPNTVGRSSVGLSKSPDTSRFLVHRPTFKKNSNAKMSIDRRQT